MNYIGVLRVRANSKKWMTKQLILAIQQQWIIFTPTQYTQKKQRTRVSPLFSVNSKLMFMQPLHSHDPLVGAFGYTK